MKKAIRQLDTVEKKRDMVGKPVSLSRWGRKPNLTLTNIQKGSNSHQESHRSRRDEG